MTRQPGSRRVDRMNGSCAARGATSIRAVGSDARSPLRATGAADARPADRRPPQLHAGVHRTPGRKTTCTSEAGTGPRRSKAASGPRTRGALDSGARLPGCPRPGRGPCRISAGPDPPGAAPPRTPRPRGPKGRGLASSLHPATRSARDASPEARGTIDGPRVKKRMGVIDRIGRCLDPVIVVLDPEGGSPPCS